jgi:hypothetical protein
LAQVYYYREQMGIKGKTNSAREGAMKRADNNARPEGLSTFFCKTLCNIPQICLTGQVGPLSA